MSSEAMNQLKEMFPFLIPLIIVQFAFLIVAIRHVLTHENYKRGSRTLWLVVVIMGMEFIGPILYFIFGKEDA